MGRPRSYTIVEGEMGLYHCWNRCVRQAYLCGKDFVTGTDYSHRKEWIVQRLKSLAGIFAVDVCDYSVLDTHWHSVLRNRPDIAAGWSDREVAIRWLKLYSPKKRRNMSDEQILEAAILLLISCPQRIAQLRGRLCSISWFMARMDEYISRKANKEEGRTGRFWESRFKCEKLLDLTATTGCMVYVDLNVIRAGLAPTPEKSDHTSIQERIHDWLEKPPAPSWLCPIASDSERLGVLDMTETEYFELVDITGRIVRDDKRGSIDPKLAPILQRLGINPREWQSTVTGFVDKFPVAAGTVSSMRKFASRTNRRWVKGISAAKAAFIDSPEK